MEKEEAKSSLEIIEERKSEEDDRNLHSANLETIGEVDTFREAGTFRDVDEEAKVDDESSINF